MISPDYELGPEDHQTVLILVKRIGEKINNKSFSKLYDKIKSVQHLTVCVSGSTRCINFRYATDYPTEKNEWGEFQAHRKVLGLITIGKCGTEENVEELTKEHRILFEKYNNSVFDSRCFAFGSDSLSPSDGNDNCKFPLENKAFSPDTTHSPSIDNLKSEVFKDDVEPVPKSHMVNEDDVNIYKSCSSPKSDSSETALKDIDVSSFLPDYNSLPNFTTDADEVNSVENSKETETQHSVYNVSNSNCSPSSPVVIDGELNISKKFIIPAPATSSASQSTHCVVYPSTDSCDQLEHDVREFVNSIFWILESKHLDRSFEKQDKVPLLTAPFEKKNFVGIDTDTKVYKKRCLGRMKKHIGDLALQAGLPLEAFAHYTTSIDPLKSGQDWLWLASAFEGQCAASIIIQAQNKDADKEKNSMEYFKIILPKLKLATSQSKSLPLNLDPAEIKSLGRTMLSFEELTEKYEEAILHYQKYQGAVVIEMECSMKAARLYTTHKRYLDATKVLQNVVFTSLVQTDEEKLTRFNALAQMFTSMGYHRKASFFKRIAAMRCVSTTNANPDWQKCYYLLLESLTGFNLPLDVAKVAPCSSTMGWPYIQVQMLFDICAVSKMMNNQAITVRHITFILHKLMGFLTTAVQQEVCRELETLTAKCEGAPVPLVLENGIAIPPVNLMNLPRIKSFKPQNLAPHLRPLKMTNNDLKLDSNHDSIFIFSPFPKGRDKYSKGFNDIDFKWVEGDVSEVVLQVVNPLPFELKVTQMGILADAIPFESFPACLSLPAESGPYPVTLLGTPMDSGKLQILGYTTHVLGVKSNCRLKDIPAIKKPYFTIDVIPSLPSVQVQTSFPKATTFSTLEDTSYVVITAASNMYSGESQECIINIINQGREPVQWVDISLQSKLNKEIESSFFTWSKQNLEAQLPIEVGSSACFTLTVTAIGDFISRKQGSLVSQSSAVSSIFCDSPASSSPLRKRSELTVTPEPVLPKIIEALLQIQYSGGPGMETGYCRQCAVALTIEVLPSIIITKWDVLPAETPNHCYLVFDIQNCSANEMEVVYASNKRILIEANDICRVPVPVQRCPLSAMTESFGDTWASVDICGHLWKRLDHKVDQRKAQLIAACRKHLENLVDLQWILSALEITGHASISQITWTDDMLGYILMSPIRWEIRVNGKLFEPEMEFNFIAGELVTFNFIILNVSEVPILDLMMCVRGYQDHQNGRQSYHIQTKRAVSGRDRIKIKEIKPHEEFFHECGFTFFHSGVYKVDIMCSHTDPLLLQTSNTLSTDSDSGVSVGSRKSKTVSTNGWQSDSCLIQKCSPTIDIIIHED